MAHTMCSRPAEMIGNERSIHLVREPAELVQVRFVERRRSEQVQPDAVQHDGVSRPHARELLPRRKRRPEEILADDLEVADIRPMLEQVPVVRKAEPEPDGVSGETGDLTTCNHRSSTAAPGPRESLQHEVPERDDVLRQLGAEIRVGDGYQRFRSLPEVLAMEVHDAVLRGDVVDVTPRGDDSGALLQRGDDARQRSLLRRRRQRDDRSSAR